MYRPFAALIPIIAMAIAVPASAAPGAWGGPSWDGSGRGGSSWGGSRWNDRGAGPVARGGDSREGRVEVSRFVAEGDAAQALGHGAVVVASRTDGPDPANSRQQATFEAAVIDRLAAVGYDTVARPEAGGQAVELKIVRTQVQPAETKRNPVSGEMTVGASNRGSMMGMAVAVDLRKPLKALYATRLEARIRDRANAAVLWEGRAEIVTREGDDRWTDDTIAVKLAGALFDRFPKADDARLSLR